MTGVRLRYGRRALDLGVPDEHGHTVRGPQRPGIDAELVGQALVERDELGCRYRRWPPRHGETGKVAGERVLELEQWSCRSAHDSRLSRRARVESRGDLTCRRYVSHGA